jgi:hypothetical protein
VYDVRLNLLGKEITGDFPENTPVVKFKGQRFDEPQISESTLVARGAHPKGAGTSCPDWFQAEGDRQNGRRSFV